jgi:hypothetical protein
MPDMDGTLRISAAVEGIVDEAVAQKLITEVGACPGSIYGKNGKSFLRQKIQGFNNAARGWPWLVLVDLDNDAECAPPLCTEWVADPALYLCFRIAVREVEAWLMADEATLASFLSVSRNKIPNDPEQVIDPKREMVNLARRSRRQAIRKDMVPREGSGRSVGPAYASRMIEYIQTLWRPEAASEKSESLRRAIASLRRMIEKVSMDD